MNKVKLILISLISLNVLLLSIVFFHKTPSIYKVDLRALINAHVEMVKSQKLTEEESNNRTKKFMHTLEEVMQDEGKRRGILLVTDAVIAGGVDVTYDIGEIIKVKLSEN